MKIRREKADFSKNNKSVKGDLKKKKNPIVN